LTSKFTTNEINIFKAWLLHGDTNQIVREVGGEVPQVQKTLRKMKDIFSKSKNYSELLESMGIIEPISSLELTDKGRSEFKKRLSKLMEKKIERETMNKVSHIEHAFTHESKDFMTEEEVEVLFIHSQKYKDKSSYSKLEQWYKAGIYHLSVYAHHERIAGKYDLQTLTDEWYKWFLTTPLPSNPFTHPNNSGNDRTSYMDRNVFLFKKGNAYAYFTATSPFQNPDCRTIIMTRSVPLLVPVYTKLASPEVFPSLRLHTGSQMAAYIGEDLTKIKGETLHATFDGEDIYGDCVLRIVPLKIANIPDDNILGLSADRLREGSTIEVYHGGFWLLLKEKLFTPGDHLLYFKAESINHEMEAKIQIKILV
jgi:hypothetical protein